MLAGLPGDGSKDEKNSDDEIWDCMYDDTLENTFE
jgi:hypothetical protein